MLIEITCSNCGKIFCRYLSQTYRKHNFCEKSCRDMFVEKNKTTAPGGYVFVRINGKRVLEHRYVMEQYLGRELSREEIVHHINGNITDNRIENLQVMHRGPHAKLHLTGKSKKS